MAVLLLNVIYFTKVYRQEENKVRQLALQHISSINYQTDDQIKYDQKKQYHLLTTQEKISYLLNKVKVNKDNHYWLANTKVQHPSIKLNPRDFLAPEDEHIKTWQNKP